MRRVIITKSYNLIAPEVLATHPQLRKYWQLPRDYTLLEMLDPALTQKDSSCGPRYAAAASITEGMLFVPFHRRIKSLADITTFHLRTLTTSYHLAADIRHVPRWPKFFVSSQWDTQQCIEIHCRLSSDLATRFQALESTIVEWAACMKKIGNLCLFASGVSKRSKYIVRCQFAKPCGHQTIALLMILADTGIHTGLKSVSFHVPDLLMNIRGKRQEHAALTETDRRPSLKDRSLLTA